MRSQGEYFQEVITQVNEKFDRSFPFVEIGTASGPSAIQTMEVLAKTGSTRWFHTIDPYGDKPYQAGAEVLRGQMGYDDSLHREAMAIIKKYALDHGINHHHWKMTSHDFMRVFPTINFWDDGQVTHGDKFAFAYLDGDHSWDPVFQEFEWFYWRMPSGAVICIDDYNLLESGEPEIRKQFAQFDGEWFFNTDDNHYRCYFTKK